MNINTKALLLATISMVSLSAAAHAQSAAPAGAITNILDGADPGTITVAGITVYGTIDVGFAYNSKAAAQDTLGGNYINHPYVLQSNGQNGRSSYQNNALSQSALGVKGTQKLADLMGDAVKGWSIGFDAAINFDPLYGDIADICKSVVRNNGITAASGQQVFAADGSRCGQLFGGDAFASLKNDTLGELRFGRQLTLLGSTIGANDPATGYAFSLFSFSGTVGAGAGATEMSRWNNSLKYTNTIGPVRVGAAYRFEGGGQGGDGWAVSGGIDVPFVKGLSIDGVYTQENTAITVASLTSGNCTAAGLTTSACESSNLVSGTVQDTEAWAIAAKYKFADESVMKGLTLMGGYERITNGLPSDHLSSNNTIGGYQLLNVSGANVVNYSKFLTDRTLDIYWIGGKYAFTPKLVGSAAWYRQDQSTYVSGNALGAATVCNGKSGVLASSNCAGSLNFYSLSLDYQVTKRLDLYAGASWTDVSDGLASGFLATNNYNLVTGARFRF